MSNLMPSDIIDNVKSVLEGVHRDPSRGRSFLTAYQILDQLPQQIRERLINERGRPGEGSGNYYAAANVVSKAAQMITDIEIALLDTSFLKIVLNNDMDILPGNQNVGLYRLRG